MGSLPVHPADRELRQAESRLLEAETAVLTARAEYQSALLAYAVSVGKRQAPSSSRLLTAREAAVKLGWHVETVYQKANAGELPSVLLGGSHRFVEAEMDAWIRSQQR